MDLGPLTYDPALELDYSWKPGSTLEYYGNGTAPSDFDTTIAQALQNTPEYYGRGGLLSVVSNELAFGRIDWAGNMRQGLSLSVTSREAYNAQWSDLISDLDLEADLFAQWGGKAGNRSPTSGDGASRQPTPGGRSAPTSDNTCEASWTPRMSGVQASILNVNLPINLFDFPTHVFIKTHILDFEFQAQPFVDLGLLRPVFLEPLGRLAVVLGRAGASCFFRGVPAVFTVRASAGLGPEERRGHEFPDGRDARRLQALRSIPGPDPAVLKGIQAECE